MKLKVMSFNLRIEGNVDGINNFPNRAEKVIRAICHEAPDLIGFQEVSDLIKGVLREHLSDKYVILGCGRMKNYRGESACIAYRRDLFELISFETFWLSNEPLVPESRYAGSDQSRCPRLPVHAELSPRGVSGTLHFFNTHLDHVGEQARILGMTQIMQRISQCKGGFVLTGDMNALPNSKEIAIATQLSARNVREATENVSLTYHGYGKIKENYKIDYIFTDLEFSDTYTVPDPHENGIYLSDHFPVCTYIEI